MFSGKILTEKSATETVGTGTQEGRHNDHFGLISDIYRNHEPRSKTKKQVFQ